MTSTPTSGRRTDAATTRSPERRFSAAEIIVHATFATLVLICIATAAIMWFDVLAIAVGRRDFVGTVHQTAGLLAPIPLAIGLLFPSFRSDVRTLEGWSDSDVEWLRSRDRRSGRIPVHRFNAGQKLNAALSIGAILVLLGTGTVMAGWLMSFPTQTRTDATWVHDWAAFALTLAVIGHVYFWLRYRRGDSSNRASEASTYPG
jgi:formate dehydrogenase subunit gamma